MNSMDQITQTDENKQEIPHLADQAMQTEDEDGIYQKTMPIPYIPDKLTRNW